MLLISNFTLRLTILSIIDFYCSDVGWILPIRRPIYLNFFCCHWSCQTKNHLVTRWPIVWSINLFLRWKTTLKNEWEILKKYFYRLSRIFTTQFRTQLVSAGKFRTWRGLGAQMQRSNSSYNLTKICTITILKSTFNSSFKNKILSYGMWDDTLIIIFTKNLRKPHFLAENKIIEGHLRGLIFNRPVTTKNGFFRNIFPV